jgi:hypothetical protein
MYLSYIQKFPLSISLSKKIDLFFILKFSKRVNDNVKKVLVCPKAVGREKTVTQGGSCVPESSWKRENVTQEGSCVPESS